MTRPSPAKRRTVKPPRGASAKASGKRAQASSSAEHELDVNALWLRVFVFTGCSYAAAHVIAVLWLSGVRDPHATLLGLDIASWITICKFLLVITVAVRTALQGRAVPKRKAVALPPAKVLASDQRHPDDVIQELSTLYEIGQGLSATIELPELLEQITHLLEEHVKMREFSILMLDDEQRFLQVKTASGFQDGARFAEMIYQVGEGVSGEVARTGNALYIRDTRKDQRYMKARGELQSDGSLLSLPLSYKQDVFGVVNFGRAGKNAFSKNEIQFFSLVANQVALAIANARLYTKTRELSVRDELTGLYNRRHFLKVMQLEWKRAVRFRRDLSLLMIDVDHFKSYNDTFGHLHGDQVLRMMSAVLQRNLREVDTIARFGGEEFIALLPDTDRAGAQKVGEKLRRYVENEHFPMPQEGKLGSLTVSIGIAGYPADAMQQEDLIDHADIALYEAKDTGRNRVVCYPSVEDATPDDDGDQMSLELPSPPRLVKS